MIKSFFKIFAQGAAFILILPAYLGYQASRICLGRDKAFPGWSQLFSLLPGLCGVYCRGAFYQLIFPRCEQGVWVGFGTIFSHATAVIGRNVYVGNFCVLGDVSLEEDVLLGSQVCIMNGSKQHGIARLDIPIREQPGEWPRITVGRDSWIGDRAVVMADVGKHCVIGAGSVVTKPIPDYAIAVGVPARIVRFRNEADLTSEAPQGALA